MVTSIYTYDARYVKDIKMYQNEYCKCKQMVKTKFYISNPKKVNLSGLESKRADSKRMKRLLHQKARLSHLGIAID